MLNLKFIEVNKDDLEYINAIYDILKLSGEYLYNYKDLRHWRTPYPKEAIRLNTIERKVFVVKLHDREEYVHTFQLEIIEVYNKKMRFKETIAEINKFATIPNSAGKGIGTQSIRFIEEFCVKNEINKIILEVYDRSFDAINFYKSKKFKVIGDKKTKNFSVLIMEKKLV